LLVLETLPKKKKKKNKKKKKKKQGPFFPFANGTDRAPRTSKKTNKRV